MCATDRDNTPECRMTSMLSRMQPAKTTRVCAECQAICSSWAVICHACKKAMPQEAAFRPATAEQLAAATLAIEQGRAGAEGALDLNGQPGSIRMASWVALALAFVLVTL